jgi:hypothetical protein
VGGISVDLAPLRTNAIDPTAAWVAHAVPGVLAPALVEAGRPGAPTSVRIDYVALGPNTGNAGGPPGSTPDQMIGTVIEDGVAKPLRALLLPVGDGLGDNRRVQLRSPTPTFPAMLLNFENETPKKFDSGTESTALR